MDFNGMSTCQGLFLYFHSFYFYIHICYVFLRSYMFLSIPIQS